MPRRPDAIALLERLIAFKTVSSQSNRALIDWVRNYLADLAISSAILPDASGLKANLIATLGPSVEGGLALSGHTDVVPVDGQVWHSDPFELTRRGSRLVGRGACDMKGFIAVVLETLQAWRTQKLRRPVHLLLSYDEELGCLGTRPLIEGARERAFSPDLVIVGEPTGMRVGTEHKGMCRLTTKVTGVEAHSSLTHRGTSAVMVASELIAHLGRLSRALARQRGSRSFEPPYTTLSVNRISGGTATNILARSCEFAWDIRVLPGAQGSAIIASFNRAAERKMLDLGREGRCCRVATVVESDAPPLKADPRIGDTLGRMTQRICLPFGTEAGFFQEAGWRSVVCGPGHIEQAHKADEFVHVRQLARCRSFLERMVQRVCLRHS